MNFWKGERGDCFAILTVYKGVLYCVLGWSDLALFCDFRNLDTLLPIRYIFVAVVILKVTVKKILNWGPVTIWHRGSVQFLSQKSFHPIVDYAGVTFRVAISYWC